MIQYRADIWWEPEITEVVVERISSANVWIAGKRIAKRAEHHAYCDTFAEARQLLIAEFTKRVVGAETQLRTATLGLQAANSLKESNHDQR